MSASAPLPHRILAQAAATPDAIAVRCRGEALSYRALHLRASALAARLHCLGVQEESTVAVLATRSIDTVVAILAIHYAGGAYVPLDPEYPREILAFTLADCGAQVVLGVEPELAKLPPHALTTVALDDADELDAALADIAPCPAGSLAYIIYTSGSTGRPKGVLLTHGNLAHSTQARLACYEQPPQRFLLLSSFAFDSSVAGLFWTLSTGGTLVLSTGEERDPAALTALIAAERITHTLCLPSLYQRLLAASGALDSLRSVIVAGEACPPALPVEHARRFPDTALFNEYGPTEATVWATFAQLTQGAADSRLPITIGKAIPGAEVRLLDEIGAPVADDEPGEIHIGGAGVARGYLNRADLTAARFLTDSSGVRLYKTGDLAQRRTDGELEFLGRLDRQVKLRGYRIELEAIEATLQSVREVQAAAVIVREDEPGDPRLTAYVAPATCAISALRALLAERLPAFMQPSAIVALDALPRMPNGKVDRAALPAPSRERPALDSAFAPPRDALENFLADEWRTALRLDRVGIHDRFFELGGDSLRAATLCAQLQEKLGEPVFVVAIFEAPTIAQLAAYLRKHYANAVARLFGGSAAPAMERRIDAARLAGVRSLIVRSPRPAAPVRTKNRRAIFILAPPRSGTTLLRAMLARHLALVTASELRLLGFRTLGERRAAYSASEGVWRQGLTQAIADCKGCDAAEAAHLLDSYERLDLGTGEFFALLQQWLGDRVLVDKSPSYALDPDCLRHAESLFADAFYIHLARHPYEMIRSFESRHMDRIYLPGAEDLSAREAGEAVWLIAHRNIRDFLATVPSHRRFDLRFSDLVKDPREQLEQLCTALALPFDDALLDPYTGGASTPSDDPRFQEHGAINPEIAEGWRGVLEDNFLSDLTWDLAEELGYEKPAALAAPQSAIRNPQSAIPSDAIAIIGMAGRFPGARDVATFWKNLCAGIESIRPFTDEELRASGLDPAIVNEPGYVNRGAQIDDADQFAASFFGYTPREAELMDPQQRIFLECAWEAFEHAGCDVSRYPGAVGVFAGLALNDYFQFNLATRPELAPLLGTYAMTLGNEKDFVATRVAHKLRLRGPAIGVQTACSTSLVALHLACQSLRSGESDMALVGGGRISVPLHAGYEYIDGGIPSPDGHCRAFDAQARGCVPANGIATVVVKRLADALRDGDRIYSVIRGTAINNDAGNKAGFTAPSVDGQAAVIARAHSAAGVTAGTIGYVEAHGTGTSLGDPIEIAALTRAFRETTDATGFCRIGSVKTNIGHLDTGAGAAGLIKAALALHHGVIPPSLHFTAPNPQIDFARSPFVVNATLTPWPRTSTPRRAGVSSFGIGGTNAHAVLEEPPLVESTPPACPWQLLVLSARTRRALEMATANLAQHLRAHPDLNLADVAHTLQTGRRAFEHRRFVIARDTAEAARFLRKRDPRRVFSTGVARGGAPLPPTPRSDLTELEALGHRWLAGAEIDWTELHAGERRLRVPLPTYPFERERYWLDPVDCGSLLPPFPPQPAAEDRPAQQAAPAPQRQQAAAVHGLDDLRAFLHTMSGVAVEKMTPETTLLALGFDSLFLTQVALALRKKFGVEITFRQLFEEYATIGALAEKVARTCSPRTNEAADSKSAPLSHGPFRPIQKEAAHELTEAQREHLATLTARYITRTAKSKARTQQHRAHFADPRTVSGFRPDWKELTYPIVVERSGGARMWDADGHEYLDFTMGFGTNLLGHSPAFITEAIAAQLTRGLEIGPQSPLAGEVARMLCEASGTDRAAFTNTGSEAVLAAVRVARTVTGRTRIATFSGYHGINDEFLIRGKTIDGQRRSMPIAPGIPEHIADGVLALDYGTDESLALLRQHAHELAAVLVEPVQSRHPDLQPREFLHEVRRITREAGVALVFDEVITGFRCHPGGAQAWFDVRADLVTYGKIIGGGLPMGALCGRREYMDALDGGAWSFGDDSRPEVGVTFFAGTFVRHPLAMAASHAMLTFLRADTGALQETLNDRTAKLVRELNLFLTDHGAPIRCESFASMFLVKFADDFSFGAVLFFLLREKGIHAWDNRLFFLSTAHTDADLAHFVRVFRQCVEEMAPWLPTERLTPGCRSTDPRASDHLERGRFATSDGSAAWSQPLPHTIPLTQSQRGLFALAARSTEASRAYNEACALDLRGPLDVARLETALQELIERHESLRTSISPDGETQTVHPRATLTFSITDCASDEAIDAQIAAVRALHFDLSSAPILDARLLRRGPDHHVLLVTLHHTFCNGPSLDVFFDELFALYQGRPLPPAMQLRDFVRRRLRSGTIAAEAFWKMQFARAAPPLDLPLDHPRPSVKTHAGGRATMEVDAALTSALRRAGAQHGASLFMTLLSAWQILLHRLSGQDDLVIGVPFEGEDRAEPGGDRLIANSTNVLPLRSRLAPETTFAELLAANRRLVLEAGEHQDYFFGDLVAALKLPFDASRAPLFNALFNFETGRFQHDLDGLRVDLVNDRAPWLGLRDTAIFELFLNVTEHEGALHCRVDFNRDLFDAATVQRWLAHLRTLLDAVSVDASRLINRLPLLNALERTQLLHEWNATALDYPREATLHGLFEETARRQPDTCAILDHGRRVTYRELDARADAVAAQLQSLGIGRETFVGVCMARTADLIAALLGVLKASAAYVPLDPSYPTERLALMLDDSGAKIVLCDESAAALSEKHPGSTWQRATGGPPVTPSKDYRRGACATATDLAYLIYTSGSTGRPKGVALEHHNAVAFVAWAHQTFSTEELAGVLASTSICFDLSIFEIFVPLAAGGTIVLAENVLELPTLPDAASVTLVNTVPSAIAELIRAWDLPPGVRTVNLAGEHLPEPLVAAVYRRGTVRRVLDLYGPTETTTYSTFTERHAGTPATIGRPIANTAIYILDEHQQPAPIGVAGEIYIGGAGVARGYWAQPALTTERFLPDPFAENGARMYRTGDRAHWRADGQLVYLGRRDQQVKVRGHRIELGEIETALAQHPAICETAVVAVTEADGEIRLIAYVVASAEMPSTPSLRDALKQRLPDFMIPSVFVALDAMPRTANGKLDRRALPAPGATERADTTEIIAPRDEEERRVAEIWRQVLKITRVGVHENFFDLGGHSLAAMQVASRLRESAHAEVNFLDVFERPTIAGLAEAIRRNRADEEVEEGVL